MKITFSVKYTKKMMMQFTMLSNSITISRLLTINGLPLVLLCSQLDSVDMLVPVFADLNGREILVWSIYTN